MGTARGRRSNDGEVTGRRGLSSAASVSEWNPHDMADGRGRAYRKICIFRRFGGDGSRHISDLMTWVELRYATLEGIWVRRALHGVHTCENRCDIQEGRRP